MFSIKKAASILLCALLLSVPLAAVSTSDASAMTREEYSLVCKQNHGMFWVAVLSYPNQGAFGWRCSLGITPATRSLNIWKYCTAMGYGGAYTNNTSDPYSWYCA